MTKSAILYKISELLKLHSAIDLHTCDLALHIMILHYLMQDFLFPFLLLITPAQCNSFMYSYYQERKITWHREILTKSPIQKPTSIWFHGFEYARDG